MPVQTDAANPEIISAIAQQTLPALYDYAFEKFGSAVVMKSHYPWGYQSITYNEISRLISLLGAGLIENGLKKQDRVALISENSPEWAVVYAAVTSCGATVVPLDARLKENEIRHLLLHSESKFLVTSPRIFSGMIEDMHLEGIHIIITGKTESKQKISTLGEIMAIGKEKINQGDGSFFHHKAEVGPDDVAAICYTSGTTGQPKGAVLLHRNIVSNTEASKLRIPFRTGDVFLLLLPLHHTFATTCNLLAPILGGCTIIFGRSMKPRDIREDITREGVTILVGVPLLFEHMIAAMRENAGEAPAAKRALLRILAGITSGLSRFLKRNVGRTLFKNQLAASGLGSLRFCVSGAAALRPDIEDAFFAMGLPILQGYGLTEASPVVSVNPLEKPRKRTVGTALPGVEIEIENPNEEGIGEITVRGGNVMKEYLKNPEATQSVLHNGVLHTGDLGRKDSEGYITVSGRKKSVIVTAGGKNVYPNELEILLNKSPLILESLVLAIKDKRGNDRVAAIIVPDYDVLGASEQLKDNLTEKTIRATISSEIDNICSGIAAYKQIMEFQIRDEELPRTTTRKVKRHLVKWIEE